MTDVIPARTSSAFSIKHERNHFTRGVSSVPRILVVLWLLILFPLSARADRLDTAFEKAIGPLFAREFEAPFGVDTDPLLTRYVSHIGETVAAPSPRKDIKTRFVLVGSDVANAYTLPGGYVMVTRGLLDSVDSDDELACILAHEVGHVAKRHATQQIGFNLGFGLLRALLPQKTLGGQGATLLAVYSVLRTLYKSRDQEAQADAEGIRFAYAAGYDPAGLVQFFDRLGGYQNRIEEYFATHPSPEKRVAAAHKSPLVAHTGVAEREQVVAGYTERGLPGLAAIVRQNGDPFAFPVVPAALPLSPALAAERQNIEQSAETERRAFNRFYRTEHIANIAQQFLLLNTQLSDPRWIYLSGRAYGVQSRIADVYARSARVLRTAPATWDALAEQTARGAPGADATVNGSIGRGETERALVFLRGVTIPLSRAQTATAAVLFDLNNRFWKTDREAAWIRYGAMEATLQYAESEIGRADRESGAAWRLLSLAKIRRYEATLDGLIPESDVTERTVWRDLLARQLGTPVIETGATGMATIRAMVGVSTGKNAARIYATKEPADYDADWVLHTPGVQPENVATALRLLVLTLERELAARKRYPGETGLRPQIR